MSVYTIILLVHAVATFYLTGLIWFVQMVHYPLFNHADPDRFVSFEQEHQRRTSLVVMAPMLVELTGAAFLIWKTPGLLTTIGLALVIIIWTSTFCLQVPAHQRLARGFDAVAHKRLVHSNWIRTIAWTLRTILVAWLVAEPG